MDDYKAGIGAEVPLESVLCTEQLELRPSRAPDYQAEIQALLALLQELKNAPRNVLQRLVETALALCRAHSAGISLLESGPPGHLSAKGDLFRWHAVAGQWAPMIWNTTTRRDNGPCGTVLDRDCALLFAHAHRHYAQFAGVKPRLIEGLLVPFYVDGQAVGTVWVVAHDDSRKFDAEDRRLLESLATFAATAYQVLVNLNAFKQQAEALLESETGFQQAEEALRESDAFSRSIFKSSPDCIKVLDLEGNLLSMQSGQELLGIEDIQPFLHKSWIEFWEGEHRQAAQAAIALARAGEAAKFVGFFRTLRGEPKWWDVAVSPILDANGKPERLLAVSRDVTERRQAELNFEFLASVSRDLVQWTSVEEMVQTVGAKMAAYFQLSLCAFVEINETAQQVVINHDWHREDVPSLVGVYRLADFVEETFIQIARAGEVIVVGNVATDSRTDPDKFATLKIASFICVPLIRDGQWRFALCLYKSAAYDWREDEIALTRELTARIWTRLERLRAEAAVLESEKRYRDLFNSIDEGFCIIELIFDGHETAVDWRYLEVNPAFEKQTGIAGITGKRIRELAPDHEEYWFETYGKVAVTGEPVRFTHEANALDGRWFDLYAFRVGGRDSCKVAVLFTNITERKRVESKLNEAIAVAKSANLAKSDFLSSMSHELRTPLSAILGFAQLIDSSSPGRTASQKRSVDQILKAGWYLLDLINEILDLALIESGKLSLSMEPMSLASVMDECQSMIEPQARARGINVTFPALDGACLVFVKADRTRVKQVLINLLSNAIKYNTVGGSVVVDCMAAVRGCVRISIKDAGAGLTAEQRAQLFQPFNRLGQESKAEEGTGIGLVLSKRLVELMGGTIGVESSVGIGSVFWIELNLTAAPQLGAGAGHGTAAVPAQGQGHAAVRTLLYVEDNPANLMLVEDIIARRPDIHLLSAADGLTGVTMALASLPDVILMDINLPGISGIQAMQILAEDPATAHIPVIALSANAMPRDIEKGLEAGFFRYLTKPIKVNEFMETLDVTLKFAETEKTRAQKMQRPLVITAGETSAP